MHLTPFPLTTAVVIALALHVTGCSPEPAIPAAAEPSLPAQAVTSVSFVCASGREITVSYPDSASIGLAYLGQAYTLAQLPAADGARYAGADLAWSATIVNGQETAVLSRVRTGGSPAGVVLERCARPVGAPVGVPVPPQQKTDESGAAPPCKGPQLQLEDAGGDAGMGNRVAIVGVRNMGSAACSLAGYPSVTLVDDRGQSLATVRTETGPGSYFRSDQTPAAVTLAPGGRAWFDVAWNVVPHEADGESVCPTAARIRMTAPADTSPVWLDHRLTPCGGRVRVTPFRAVAEPVPPPS